MTTETAGRDEDIESSWKSVRGGVGSLQPWCRPRPAVHAVRRARSMDDNSTGDRFVGQGVSGATGAAFDSSVCADSPSRDAILRMPTSRLSLRSAALVLLCALNSGMAGCGGNGQPTASDDGPASSTTRAAPDLLPLATGQAPGFGAYTGAGLQSGASYRDPVSGVLVWKVTDATTPAANSEAYHDYATGAMQISREWGGNRHTLLVAAGGRYLVDLTRGVGLGNWRPAPATNADLSFTFSAVPATPQIAYHASGTTLYRSNTATNQAAPTGFFPRSFSAVITSRIKWLQQDEADRWFVFMPEDQSRIVAWNSQTDQVLVKTATELAMGIDEPHLERQGRYVLVRDGSTAWKVWDLQTNAVWAGSPGGQTHPAAVRGLFTAFDPNVAEGPFWRYDPATRGATTFLRGQVGASTGEQHRGDQWIQTDAELGGTGPAALARQWLLFNAYDDGGVTLGTWQSEGGEVYSAPVSGLGLYDYATVGVRAVRQRAPAPAPANQYAHSLTAVGSRAALTAAGQFWFDPAQRRLYVWAQGGASPAGRVEAAAAGALHDALGFYRLDGSEVRLLAHHYSTGIPNYWQMPRGTLSVDGKLAMWSSNMNGSPRGDVFVAEVPLR